MMEAKEIKNHYTANFDATGYIQCVENRGKDSAGLFLITSVAEIFSNPDFQGTTLLEIGSGPTVHSIVPACKKYSHIVLSDFVDSSCEEIKKWLGKEEGAMDWTQVLRSSAVAQGYRDPDAAIPDIEALIRRNVKAVVHCDVLAENILPPEFNVPYDLVLTSLTLEAACNDYGAFKACLRKINRLVKLGGHLVMAGFLKGSSWGFGGKTFPYLSLSREDIQLALEEGGFGKIGWKILPNNGTSNYVMEASYCLCSVKNNEINE